MDQKASIFINGIIYTSLFVTWLFLFATNPDHQLHLSLLWLGYTLIYFVRHHRHYSLSNQVIVFLMLLQLLLAFFITAIDGSFVPQILLFIIIAESAFLMNKRVSIPIAIIAYGCFVVGVAVNLHFPSFSELLFVIPRLLEYILFFGFSYISKITIEQKEQLNLAYERLSSAGKELEKKTLMEERVRLSREIHDTIGHTLTTAIVGLESVKRLLQHQRTEEAFEKLTKAQEHIKKGLAEVRRSVKTLHEKPSFLQFVPSLEALAKETSESTGVSIHCHIGDLPKLTPEQELTLFRAFQEGLTNGIRHGQSTEFFFTLEAKDERIWFELIDNGQTTTPIKPGFGLTMMNDRVQSLGGEIHISRHGSGGVHLGITLPMTKPIDGDSSDKVASTRED